MSSGETEPAIDPERLREGLRALAAFGEPMEAPDFRFGDIFRGLGETARAFVQPPTTTAGSTRSSTGGAGPIPTRPRVFAMTPPPSPPRAPSRSRVC